MTRTRRFAVAATFAAMLPGAGLAQAPAAAPPPAWAQGRTPEMAASPLAPHAPKMTVTPADQLPIAALRVPAGFKVEVWASGMPGARMMALGDRGTVFVGSRIIGRVYAVTDQGGQRTSRLIAERLRQPNGIAFKDGALYVTAINQVMRYDGIETAAATPTPVDMTAAFALPTEEHHGWKFSAFGPDGRLYFNVGVPCNICEFDRDRFALIQSHRPDGSDRRIEARGIRNSVGFDWHPATRELWATNNGRDWAGNDIPPDTLHRIRRSGEDHGFPFCVGMWNDPAVPQRACTEFVQPAAAFGAHVAALGMRFYTGTAFPAAYRNQAFVARRGSWNREVMSGYDVVVAKIDGNGNVTGIEPFLTGFLDAAANKFVGRPVDVLMLRDGSMLVSDEQNGAIYRVSHGS